MATAAPASCEIDFPDIIKITQTIKSILERNPRSQFASIARHHLEILRSKPDILLKREKCFSSKKEYQDFFAAKMFFKKIERFEFPTSCPEILTDGHPKLSSFHMSEEEKRIRNQNFLKVSKQGSVLHLRVLDDDDDKEEYNLLVLNQYGCEERIIDYSVKAYIWKNSLVKAMGPLEPGDLIRAAIFVKIKDENCKDITKLVVSIKTDHLAAPFKHVKLGRVSKEDIEFYPEDVDDLKCSLDYLKTKRSTLRPKNSIKNLEQWGLDPYKVYSFHAPSDGLKGEKKNNTNIDDKEKKIEESVNAFIEAEKCFKNKDYPNALFYLDESLRAYENDRSYALRGALHLELAESKDSHEFENACKDFEAALKLNPFNQLAKKKYSAACMTAIKKYSDEGDNKSAETLINFVYKLNNIVPSETESCVNDSNQEEIESCNDVSVKHEPQEKTDLNNCNDVSVKHEHQEETESTTCNDVSVKHE